MEDKTSFIFLYGTLQQGRSNYPLIEDIVTFVSKAMTIEKFPLISQHGLPYILPFPGSGNRVPGELFEVSEKDIDSIDYIEGVPHHYNRLPVRVIYGDKKSVAAWAYVRSLQSMNLESAKVIDEY